MSDNTTVSVELWYAGHSHVQSFKFTPEEAERFETEYLAWLKSGQSFGEFQFDTQGTRVCLRLESIIMRRIGPRRRMVKADDIRSS